MTISIYNRKAKFAELKPYCHLAGSSDFIELTEWANGEGFEVTLSSKNREQHFSLTYGEFQALLALHSYNE